MAKALASRRPEALLLLFAAGYLLALSLQVRRGGDTVLGGLALTLFRPALTVYDAASRFSREGSEAYVWQRDAALRNEALERENRQLQGERHLAESLLQENLRLRTLLSIPAPPGARLAGARALMRYGEPFGRYLLVDCEGAPAPVLPDTPVLDPEGLVGKIQGSSGRFYRVLMVTDPGLAVGVMSERTKVHGVTAGEGRRIEVRYITNEADVLEGDRFVTSGEDGVFPAGLPVGTVETVADGGDYLKRIRLKPAAALDNLSWVLLAVKARA